MTSYTVQVSLLDVARVRQELPLELDPTFGGKPGPVMNA
jgi:hypothetical protein